MSFSGKIKSTITILLLAVCMSGFSQEVLLQQNVKADTIRPSWGPNMKHYILAYVGLGFPVYTTEAVNFTKPLASSCFDFGVRYKRRITNFLALGADLGVDATAFKLKQEQGKTVPDTIMNKKEKFQINSLIGSAYIRFNAGRRGNYIGNYLDLGAYGGWNMVKKHKTINENTAGEKVKVETTGLKYVENFSYGLLARLGTNRYALTARYRFSDLFVATYAMPELPRLARGFDLSLFK